MPIARIIMHNQGVGVQQHTVYYKRNKKKRKVKVKKVKCKTKEKNEANNKQPPKTFSWTERGYWNEAIVWENVYSFVQ